MKVTVVLCFGFFLSNALWAELSGFGADARLLMRPAPDMRGLHQPILQPGVIYNSGAGSFTAPPRGSSGSSAAGGISGKPTEGTASAQDVEVKKLDAALETMVKAADTDYRQALSSATAVLTALHSLARGLTHAQEKKTLVSVRRELSTFVLGVENSFDRKVAVSQAKQVLATFEEWKKNRGFDFSDLNQFERSLENLVQVTKEKRDFRPINEAIFSTIGKLRIAGVSLRQKSPFSIAQLASLKKFIDLLNHLSDLNDSNRYTEVHAEALQILKKYREWRATTLSHSNPTSNTIDGKYRDLMEKLQNSTAAEVDDLVKMGFKQSYSTTYGLPGGSHGVDRNATARTYKLQVAGENLFIVHHSGGNHYAYAGGRQSPYFTVPFRALNNVSVGGNILTIDNVKGGEITSLEGTLNGEKKTFYLTHLHVGDKHLKASFVIYGFDQHYKVFRIYFDASGLPFHFSKNR